MAATMRKRLLIIAAAVLALGLGLAVAALIVANRPPAPGGLETAPTDVSVVTPTDPTARSRVKPPPPEAERRSPLLADVRRRPDAQPRPARDPARRAGTAAAMGARAEVVRRVPAELLRRRALRQHLQGRHVGDRGRAPGRSSGGGAARRASRRLRRSAARILIVSAKDGTVSALSRRTGRLVWQLRTQRQGRVVARDGRRHRLLRGDRRAPLRRPTPTTGKIRWVYDTGGRINSSPSLANGRVCITTYAGSILCLRARTARGCGSRT